MKPIFQIKYRLIGGFVAIVGVIFFISQVFLAPVKTDSPSNVLAKYKATVETSPISKEIETPSVVIGKTIIPVEVQITKEEVEKGLSGRTSLDPNEGMLFLFKTSLKYRFWMPDMHFPIDIIWIDENKKIAGIHENVSPVFDPKNPKFYVAPKAVRYVLEVNAGFSEKNGIGIGNEVIFDHVEN